MELISTHDSADFDALASLVAASRLYPGARMALTVNIGEPVRGFLALHKDRFVFHNPTLLDLDAVERWILVDVRRASRLHAYHRLIERARQGDPSLALIVYDHHPAAADDLPATRAIIARVGSATTLLVEQIAAAQIDIDPVEATLFALGIHVDTGSLAYADACARDAAALGWLMDHGACNAVVRRYLDAPLHPVQRRLLQALLGRARVHAIGGLNVALVDASRLGPPSGLDLIASELMAIEGHNVLFLWSELRHRRVQLVGRCKSGALDIGRVLTALGGGGQASAGAATLKDIASPEVSTLLLAAVAQERPHALCVRDIMTSPAHVIAPSMPLRVLKRSLTMWRHTGVPVVDDQRLVGLISARDLEHIGPTGWRHPVKSRMRRNVITTTPDTPLESALDAMVSADVGRLPVLQGEHVVGIITRSDIRRVLYQDAPTATPASSPARGR